MNDFRMQLRSGMRIDSPADLRPQHVMLDDILYPLAYTYRFGGHLPHPWSVLQHSLLCYELAKATEMSDEVQLACMTHDFAEAYLGDIVNGLKPRVWIQNGSLKELFCTVEERVLSVIRFALQYPVAEDTYRGEVKLIDRLACALEADMGWGAACHDWPLVKEFKSDAKWGRYQSIRGSIAHRHLDRLVNEARDVLQKLKVSCTNRKNGYVETQL